MGQSQIKFAGAAVRVAGPDSLDKTTILSNQIIFPVTPTAASPGNRLLLFPELPWHVCFLATAYILCFYSLVLYLYSAL